MTFTVKYRANDGTMREERIEAASRSECVAKCKVQGIALISVKEGGGNAESHRRGKRRVNVRQRVVFSVVVMLFILSGVGVWCWSKYASDSNVEIYESEKPVIPKSKVKYANSTSKKVQPIISDVNSKTEVIDAPDLPNGLSVTNTPSLPSLPPATFNNVSDQLFSMIASDDGTGSAPPMPISRDIEAQFLESLKHEIVILDSDDERIKAIKESVIELRKEVKRLVDSGMTISQVLAEHQKLANENAEMRNKAMLELKEIIDSGDIEGAKEYKRKMNVALQQLGITALSIPVTEEERAERSALRRERMLRKRAMQNGAE